MLKKKGEIIMKKVKINTILFTLLASSFLLPITSLADEITETDLTKTIETTHAGEGIGASEHATLQTDGKENPSTEKTEAPYNVALQAALKRINDWYQGGGVTQTEMTEMLNKVHATTSIAELEALGFTDGSEVDLELVAPQEDAYERVKDWYEAGHGSYDEAQALVDQIYASTSLSQLEELGFTDGPTISPELILAQDKSYAILIEAYHEKKVTHPELNDLVDCVYKTKTIAELKGIMAPFTPEETDTETPSEPDKPTETETPGESDKPTETRTSAGSSKSSKEKIESNQETTALPQTNEVKNSSWLVGGLSTLIASFSLFRRNN